MIRLSTPCVVRMLAIMLTTSLALASCSSAGAEFALIAGATPDRDGIGFAFAGDEISPGAPTLTVTTGEEVTIELESVYGLHDFAVVPAGIDDLLLRAVTGAIADEVLWEAAIPGLVAGETGTVTFLPDTPGTYQYLCTIPGHARDGMLGDLIVEAAG